MRQSRWELFFVLELRHKEIWELMISNSAFQAGTRSTEITSDFNPESGRTYTFASCRESEDEKYVVVA
jgi:hypothetical protein